MNDITHELRAQYAYALQEYLAGRGEATLNRAYELGRRAITSGVGLLDIAAVHQEAMAKSLLGTIMPKESTWIANVGDEFWRECLAPFEMTLRGYQEANKSLRLLNEMLEQRVAERTAELRAAVERLRMLNDFARLVSGTLDPNSLFQIVVRQAPALVGCQSCAIIQYNATENFFRYVAIWPHEQEKEPLPEAVFRPEDTVSSIALRTRAPYVLNNTSGVPLSRLPELAQVGIRSLASVPIVIGDEVWGTLDVGFERTGGVTPDRVEFLGAIATHLAVGVKNAELYTRLQAAYAELQQTQQQIIKQERLRALGQMASGIAHDFNNALTPILGFSELMLMRPDILDDKEKVKGYLELINSGAKDAADMVGRLREFYRSREEGAVLAPVDISQVVRQAVTLTQPRWRDQALGRGVTIHINTDLHKVPRVAGDEGELRQAVTNLIFNAVDALLEDGTISIHTYVVGEYVVLQVKDTGTGMTEEVRQRCFEPFFTTKGERGTGLGLARVYGIVRRHEGTIGVESELGSGTTLTIRLPVQTVRRRGGNRRKGKSQSRPLRVLVVDDEPLVREVVSEYLTGDGHTVETATNGREGLAKFLVGRFDLVLTDKGMPEMSGDLLAAEIKQVAPNTSIILLTGFGETVEISDGKPMSVDLVVSKPVTLAALREALAKAKPTIHPD